MSKQATLYKKLYFKEVLLLFDIDNDELTSTERGLIKHYINLQYTANGKDDASRLLAQSRIRTLCEDVVARIKHSKKKHPFFLGATLEDMNKHLK